MQIDVKALEEFMETVNLKLNENDPAMVQLAESFKRPITQYNVETNYLGTITPEEWVSDEYRQRQGWPQQLWKFREAWNEQAAKQAEQQEAQSGTDSALKEALEELRALKAEIAELREAQAKPNPVELVEPPAADTEEEAPEEEA